MKTLTQARIVFVFILLMTLSFVVVAQGERLKLEILNGHSGGGVLAVAVSSDGKFALTGSTDTTALLWDLATGKQLRRFAGYHEDAVSAVQFSKDGRFVLTASHDGSAQLWETATGKRIRGFGGLVNGFLVKHCGKILSAAISADMKFVATAGEDKTAQIWELQTGKRLFKLEHSGRVNSIAFSPDSAHLLTGSAFFGALFSTETGHREPLMIRHSSEVVSVTFSPDGRKVLTGDINGKALIWDRTAFVKQSVFEANYTAASQNLFSVNFMPKGNSIILAESGGVRIVDLSTGYETFSDTETNRRGYQIAISPDESKFLKASDNYATVQIRDISKNLPSRELTGRTSAVNSVDISVDDSILVAGAGDYGSSLWIPSQTEVKVLAGKSLSAVFSPAGQIFAQLYTNGNFTLFDGKNGAAILMFEFDYELDLDLLRPPTSGSSKFAAKKYVDRSLSALTFSRDGDYIISGSGDGKVLFRENPNARTNSHQVYPKEELLGHTEKIHHIATSPNFRQIATSSGDKSVRIWNTKPAMREVLISSFVSSVWAIEFSPDGKRLATASGGEIDMSSTSIGSAAKSNSVRLFDVETGKEIDSFGQVPDGILNKFVGFKSVAYSPDGKFIAAGSFDGKVALRDKETKSLRNLEGHSGVVNSVKFAKDANGRLLVVSGSSDSTTRIWDAASGKEICKLVTFRDGTWAVVDPAGRYDAPNGGEIEGIQWVYGNETIALNQLKDVFYTPNLLPRLLGYNKEPLRPVPDLKSLKLFPKIFEQTLDEANARLTVKLQNRGGGIGEVRILVNGKLATEDARDAQQKANPNAAEATITFDLKGSAGFDPQRKNTVEVITNNFDPATKKGYISSRGAELVYRANALVEVKQPNFYAVVGGVSNYNGTSLDLAFAAKDAEEFGHALELGARRLFCKNENLQCEKVMITVLSTSGKAGTILPTKANYRQAIADVAKAAKPEDVFVIYLAGHGTSLSLNGKDTYLYLTQEADSASKDTLEKPDIRTTSAISSEELLDWLTQTEWIAGSKGVQALKQVMILDTCAAGSAVGDLSVMAKRDLTADQILALERLKDRTGFHILMGSAADQSSYEANRYGQGLLTYALLQGIKGAALDRDQVGTQALFDYAVKTVPTLANGIGGVQQPRVFGSTSIPIGLITESDKNNIKLATPKPVLLRPLLTNPETGDDDLRLIVELRKRLGIESSYEVVRRRDGKEPVLVYIDDDTFPGGIRITGTYTVEDDNIRIKAFLRKDGKTIATLPEITIAKAQAVEELTAVLMAVLAKL